MHMVPTRKSIGTNAFIAQEIVEKVQCKLKSNSEDVHNVLMKYILLHIHILHD